MTDINQKKKIIELIKKELYRQRDEDRCGTPYVSDVFWRQRIYN